MAYVPYWRDTLLSTRWLKSDWKASEGEKQAYICWCFNKDIHCMFVEGSQEQSFFLQTLLFTPFVATVQKIITYALVSTWSWVSSGWEHVTRFMHHCLVSVGNFGQNPHNVYTHLGKPSKKIRDYLGIFPNMGGGLPNSQNFCYFNHRPKYPL